MARTHPVASPPAQHCKLSPLARRPSSQALLLIGVASLALLAGTKHTAAAEFTWAGIVDVNEAWEDVVNWSSPLPGTLPGSTDDVTIGADLNAVIVDNRAALTVQLDGGINIHRTGTLTVGSGITHTGTGFFINDGTVDADILNNGYIANTYRVTGDLDNQADGGVVNDGTSGGMALWTGDLLTNAGAIFNSGGQWDGDVKSTVGYIQNYDDAIWNGVVVANTGMIENDDTSHWNGDVESNTGYIGNSHVQSVWTGDALSNEGTIFSNGIWNGSLTSSGILRLGNAVNGAISNSGTLQVFADLGGITSLTNTGMIDMTFSDEPDRVIGRTLSAVDATFGAASVLRIGVDAAGASDAIVLSGAAALDGTVEITAATGATYNRNTSYTILSAQSISGAFTGATTDLAFLVPQLSQDATTVTLTLNRNDIDFASFGNTPTQRQIGGIVEASGAGNAIYEAVVRLTEDQAPGAFDALSGAGYLASEQGLVQSADLIGTGLADRIDQSFDALGSGDGSVSNYAASASPITAGSAERGLWGQVYGAMGTVDDQGTTAGTTTEAAGMMLGLDGMLGDWRLGLMLNAGTSRASSLGLSTTSTDYGLGIYGGQEWGATRLSLGVSYIGHAIDATRHVVFPGFSETLSADYGAGTALAFARLSHEFDLGALSVTPYGSLTQVHQVTDGFTETGGAAALTGGSSVVNATFTAIGLGLAQKFALGEDGTLLTASGSLGWRHAFSDDPAATHAFTDGGSFSVAGAALASDSVLVGAGLNLDLSAQTTIDLHYDGQFSDRSQNHGIKAAWNAQF